MRHFITGLFGTGKTTLAKRLAGEGGAEYIGFDQLWDDSPITPEKCQRVFDVLPRSCIVDAIPYDPTWKTFNEWGLGCAHVTAVFCSEDEWERRNAARKQNHPCGRERWSGFWLDRMPSLEVSCAFYDTDANAYVNRAQMLNRVGFNELLMERLEASPNGYDWTYQDIDEIAFDGYAPCADTWSRVRQLADWGGMRVADMGCNHAYMLWRAEDAGARELIGLDESSTVLETARCVRFMRGSDARLQPWSAGDPVPEADITLCLNMLHHVEDPSAALAQVRSPILILESPAKGDKGQDLVAAMHSAYPKVDVSDSSRVGRRIYRCSRT